MMMAVFMMITIILMMVRMKTNQHSLLFSKTMIFLL